MEKNIRGYRDWPLDHEYLPTNEATLPTFTCSAGSNYEYINHKLTK